MVQADRRGYATHMEPAGWIISIIAILIVLVIAIRIERRSRRR
jgi:hypothetical protein